MKYTIIICILFAIINSKEIFPNKLGIVKSFLGKTTLGSEVSNVCKGIKTKDQCLAEKILSKNYNVVFNKRLLWEKQMKIVINFLRT